MDNQKFQVEIETGIVKEAELKSETMRMGKEQDIEIYSIMRCKNENNN